MVGGGLGSQIGVAHRVAACMDGLFEFSAGAVDIDPAKGHADGIDLGLPKDRTYGTWREMLHAEMQRSDRLDLVTVATPNATHFEIVRAFLDSGFNVLCEKPFTLDVAEAEELVRLAREKESVCGVNFGFSGYPMVRQAKAMANAGELGRVRVVVMEFAHGFHARSDDADNPRIRWRYDPKQAGQSAVLADAGIHALHMGGYIIGQSVAEVSADFASCVQGRLLEDDAALQIRFSDGTIGRLWTSAIAVGQMHGLTIRIFGEKGGLRWRQEEPNQIIWSPLGEFLADARARRQRTSPDRGPGVAHSDRPSRGNARGVRQHIQRFARRRSRRPCRRANRRNRGLSWVQCGSGNGQGCAGRHSLVEELRTVDSGLIKGMFLTRVPSE